MKVNFFNQTMEDVTDYENKIKEIFSNKKHEKSIEIIFVNNEEIKKMNEYYRKINEPTDVLTFVNDNYLDTSLGDIFISLEKAKKQAKQYNHSLLREVCFLAVHGYLHLLGYDHNTKEEEKKMFEKQEEILKKHGLERK